MSQNDNQDHIDDEATENAKRIAAEKLDIASEKINIARDKAVEALDALSDRANQYARKGVDKAIDMQHRAKEGIHRAGNATAHYVEEQPLKSVAIAAGVGAAAMAVLMLLSGRRR